MVYFQLALVTFLLGLSHHVVIAQIIKELSESAFDLDDAIPRYMCKQRMWFTRVYKSHHWAGLELNSSFALPLCSEKPGSIVRWFEGHVPGSRRLLPLKWNGGWIFGGCGFYLSSRNGLVLNLRFDECSGWKRSQYKREQLLSMSLTCLATPENRSSEQPAVAEVHIFQLAIDQRCPPGTARDRLGLCRSCPHTGPCCWQPDWDAIACPAGCQYNDNWFNGDGAAIELQRAKRSVTAEAKGLNNQNASSGIVKVPQLNCPTSLMRTLVCLLEMHHSTRREIISLLVVAYGTTAFLCAPLYITYVMMQLYTARFLPLVQFHLFERSALLSSSMRTQALFSPSLWDFKAFHEAEKRHRLAQKKVATSEADQFNQFELRELHNVLLWLGIPKQE